MAKSLNKSKSTKSSVIRMKKQWWNFILVLFLFLIALPSPTEASNNFSFVRESIMTVCDVYNVKITSKGEPIPECDELPSAKDFFIVDSNSLWEMPCDDTSNDEPQARRPTIWDRTIRTLHWLLEGIQNKIAAFGDIASRAVQDVSRLSLITKQWNIYWYFFGGLVASLLFFIQGLYISRPGTLGYNIFLNILMGYGGAALFYMVHLYFKNVYVMGTFIAIFLYTLTPWYVHCRMSAIGILTSMELLIPLFGMLVKVIFETNLYFGPILSLYINCGGIVIHILCLLALYIDEKLILVKVFFLPFYRMVQRIFGIGQQNQKEIDFMKASAKELNRELFTTFGVATPVELSLPEQLNAAFTKALNQACKLAQGEWEDECWYFIRDKCSEATWNAGFLAYMIGWIICPRIAYESCGSKSSLIDLEAYCNAPEMTAFGAAYKSYTDAIDKLRDEIIIDPLKPKVNTEILEMAAGFDIFANRWTWWVRHIISFGMSGLVISLVVLALFSAVVFLIRYRRDLYFCNNYLSRSIVDLWKIRLSRREKLRYYSSFVGLMYEWINTMMEHPSHFAKYTRLIVEVMVCFWIEQSAKLLSWHLNDIHFVVPEYGEARFVFNVQGDGAIAKIIRAILGGFSLQSKYCKIADSSVCNTVFIPVDWRTWLMLFSLAIFYFLIGIYKTKSDYIMCRICDFLIPKKGEARAEVTLLEVLEERRKREIVVEMLAKEEIEDPVFLREQNLLVLAFYQPRRWYHRFMPTTVLSIIARCTLGIDSILCQVCGQDLVTGRFRCNALLLCDECRFCLTKCPCGSDSCKDGEKFDI